MDSRRLNRVAIALGTLSGLGLAIYFALFKRNNKANPRGIKKSGFDNLSMERYVFDLAGDEGVIKAIVEQAGDCYSVHLNEKFLGNMWRDEQKGMQWTTADQKLEPYMWEISVHLSEAFSRRGYPSLLMGAYPEIIATNWKTDETLEVVIKESADMEVFTAFLKDEVLNLVTFEEHLDLIVKKENDSYFIIIGIN